MTINYLVIRYTLQSGDILTLNDQDGRSTGVTN